MARVIPGRAARGDAAGFGSGDHDVRAGCAHRLIATTDYD
jgi:hypothetical protein